MSGMQSVRNPCARASYSYTVRDGLVSIIDRDEGGMSVTNDAAAVLAEIAARERIDLDRHLIAYRDSMGRWDGMNTRGGVFCGFFPLDQKAFAGATTTDAPKKPAKVGPVVVVDPKGPLPDGTIRDTLEEIARGGLPVVDPLSVLQTATGPKPRLGKRKPAPRGNDG